MGTIKAKIITVAFLTLPLSGCLYGPGFHGTNVPNQGMYNWGIAASLSPVAWLGYSGMIMRGMGKDWDLGLEFGGANAGEFALFSFRARKQLEESTLLFGKAGYFGDYLPTFFHEDKDWYISGEISIVKALSKDFYWGYGIGLAEGPLFMSGDLALPMWPYPQIFLGYQYRFLTVELESTPWPKVGIIITRGRY